jgi:integrase
VPWIHPYRHKDGTHSWRVGWRTPEGQSRSKAFRVRREADDFARRVEGKKAEGDYQDPALGRITLAACFDEFMEQSGHLKPSTRALYRRLFDVHVRVTLGGRPIASITRSDVKTLLAPLTPTTARTTYRLVRRVLSAAVEDGRIRQNPAARIKLPPEAPREARFLTPQEVHRLALATEDRYRAMILLMAYGGLRMGEASALRVGDVDFLRGRVTVSRNSVEVDGRLTEGTPKGGSVRTVRIPGFVVEELSRHVRDHAPDGAGGRMFTTETGAPVRQSRFRRHVFTPAAKEAGLEGIRPHDLRHTSVALAVAAGYHPKAIQELAGHASITMTLDHYGHLFDTLQDEGVKRLDEMAREAEGTF